MATDSKNTVQERMGVATYTSPYVTEKSRLKQQINKRGKKDTEQNEQVIK